MFHWIYPVTPPGASKTNECNSITARIPVNGVRNRCFSCVYLEGTTTCAHTFLNQQVYNFMQKKTAVRTARKANVEEFVPLCYCHLSKQRCSCPPRCPGCSTPQETTWPVWRDWTEPRRTPSSSQMHQRSAKQRGSISCQLCSQSEQFSEDVLLQRLIVSFIAHHVEGTLLPVGGVHLIIIRGTGGNGGFGSQSLHNQQEWIIITCAHSYSFLFTDKDTTALIMICFVDYVLQVFSDLKKILINLKYIL